MSDRETVIVSFRIEDGIISRVTEMRGMTASETSVLTGPRDIEDAVARVAGAPVGGKTED